MPTDVLGVGLVMLECGGLGGWVGHGGVGFVTVGWGRSRRGGVLLM